MARYMVEIDLPLFKNAEFMSLIPEQRAQIMRLLQSGRLATFSLNEDRTKGWMVISGKSESHIWRTLENFPLSEFMEFKVHSLSMFDSAIAALPTVTMN